MSSFFPTSLCYFLPSDELGHLHAKYRQHPFGLLIASNRTMRLFDVSVMVNAGFVRPGSSPLFFTLEPGKPAQGLPRSTRLGPFYALTLSGIFFLLVTKIGASEGIRIPMGPHSHFLNSFYYSAFPNLCLTAAPHESEPNRMRTGSNCAKKTKLTLQA